MENWPLSNLKWKNAIAIWYLIENELIWGFWGYIDLKQLQNYKFKIVWAQAISAASQINWSVAFIIGSKKIWDQIMKDHKIAVLLPYYTFL